MLFSILTLYVYIVMLLALFVRLLVRIRADTEEDIIKEVKKIGSKNSFLELQDVNLLPKTELPPTVSVIKVKDLSEDEFTIPDDNILKDDIMENFEQLSSEALKLFQKYEETIENLEN